MALRVYIHTYCGNPKHAEINLGDVNSLEEGTVLLKALGAEWEKWTGDSEGAMGHEVPLRVSHYEGSETYAEDKQTKKVWAFNDEDDVWEEWK